MHEGAIVKSIFESAKEIKSKEKLVEITTIKIIVGKFHQVVRDVMFTYFNNMKLEYKGFEQAELKMIEKDVKVKCKSCKKEFTIDSPIMMCPYCNSFETELISGKELHIATIQGTR